MAKPSPLDQPENAAHAWARYRRLMRWMAMFTLTVVVLVLGFLRWEVGPSPIHFYIATGLGIGAAMMLMAASDGPRLPVQRNGARRVGIRPRG